MAIAHAVMEHLVAERQCKTLFITHYPAVATELAARFPNDVLNAHMGFREDTRLDGRRDIAFMYKLTDGLAAESFGIECARLAGLPDDVLDLAQRHAERMRRLVEKRRRRNRYVRCTLNGSDVLMVIVQGSTWFEADYGLHWPVDIDIREPGGGTSTALSICHRRLIYSIFHFLACHSRIIVIIIRNRILLDTTVAYVHP